MQENAEMSFGFLRNPNRYTTTGCAATASGITRFGEAIVEAMETREGRIETAFSRDGRVDVRPGDFVMLGVADAPMSCRIEILDDDAVAEVDRQLDDILA
jgi:hypothetical protein